MWEKGGISVNCTEAYKEHIEYTFNAFCRVVIHYDPSDEELSALRIKARKLARRYNSTDEDNWETLNEILKELVLNRGEGTFFQVPVYFDYGCFTTFGKNCGANFNFTVLDCAPVKIGDNVMFGPNCNLAAPMHPLCPKERNVRTRENGELYNLEYARGNAAA